MTAWLKNLRTEFHRTCIQNGGPISISPTSIKISAEKNLYRIRGGAKLPRFGSSPSHPKGKEKTSVDVLSNADNGSPISMAIAEEVAHIISRSVGPIQHISRKPDGQRSGTNFEKSVADFVEMAFGKLCHLRRGNFVCRHGGVITHFDQYAHLEVLETLAKGHDELKTALGADYLIKPDVVIFRLPESDESINANIQLVSDEVAQLTPLREANSSLPSLHASISCKLTMRSDRAQNSRSEALNLIRNRKGRLPHVVAVTAEPLPSRIASLALGTGDLDCVYHFALPELQKALDNLHNDEGIELVNAMVEGKRLRDIADLPLDLVI
jgi:hypothetical protein